MLHLVVPRHALLLRHAFGSRALSFRVHRGTITAPSHPIHENQRVECTWTIRHDDSALHRHDPRGVEKLKVLTPGLTIVRVCPELCDLIGDDAVARVRVSSSSTDVVRSVHIAAAWPNRTRVDFRAPSRDHECVGHLVTEIDLAHANAVRSLAAIGLGDVVVAKNVLFAGGEATTEALKRDAYRGRGRRHRRRSDRGLRTTQALQLFAANESRLFIDASTTAMRLDALHLGALGASSQITMNVAGLDIQRSVDVAVAGGRQGGVALTTDSLLAPQLRILVVGEGDFDLAVHRHLEVDDAKTFAMGESSIYMQGPEGEKSMSTRHQATIVAGATCIDTASLLTEHGKIVAIGSNDVRLQPRDGLRVRSVGSNVVECVGRIPRQLDVRGLPSPTLLETPNAETESVQEPYDGVHYPTVEEAFRTDTVLSRPAPWRFLSRWFGQKGDRDSSGKTSRQGEDLGSAASPRSSRHRRLSRWADDPSSFY